MQLILFQAETLDLMALPVVLLGIYAYRQRWALGLLLGLPLLWFPQLLAGEPPALPLLISLLSYLILAAQFLSPTETQIDWEQARPATLEPLPWLAGLLVLAGSLGVLAWSPIQEALNWGFPEQRSNAAIFLILLFSGAHRRFALGAKRVATRINAWPEDLIKWILVMMYTSAGVSKLMQQPRWLSTEGVPVLYRIMTDPMAAWLDPVIAQPFYPLFRVGGWATIALECVAVLLMTRLGRYWAILGAGMHLGIATFMNLGMFSWAMLALYPVLFAPWLCRALDARAASRG